MGTKHFGEGILIKMALYTLLMPLPPLPTFRIQIKKGYLIFVNVCRYVMREEEMHHLRNPPNWISNIKLMHVQLRTMISLMCILENVVLRVKEPRRRVILPQIVCFLLVRFKVVLNRFISQELVEQTLKFFL